MVLRLLGACLDRKLVTPPGEEAAKRRRDHERDHGAVVFDFLEIPSTISWLIGDVIFR